MTLSHPPTTSHELQILFKIAERASDNDESKDSVYINDKEYEGVERLAARHGMGAMLERQVGGRGVKASGWNTRRNLRMTGELVRILKAFDRESIRVIAYKGPSLAWLAYGDLGSREFGDLDLLIERSSLSRVYRLMVELGYVPEIELRAAEFGRFAATTNVLAWWHSGKEVSVEVHWELSPRYLPFSVDFEALYERRRPSYPGGCEVMTLSIEDLLVYLCLHGAKHGWERLSWIIDIGGLLKRRPEMDWDVVAGLARADGCERAVGLGLALAGKVTGVEAPAIRLIGNDPGILELVDQVIGWLDAENAPSLIERTKFLLRLQSGIVARMRMLYRILTTPSVADWRAIRLPAALSWVYLFVRPVRLMRQGAKM